MGPRRVGPVSGVSSEHMASTLSQIDGLIYVIGHMSAKRRRDLEEMDTEQGFQVDGARRFRVSCEP